MKLPKFTGNIWNGPKPCGMTRRDFIARGLATATVATALPSFLLRASEAAAATLPTCAPQTRVPGAIAQIYRDGGNARGAMFFDTQLANAVNSTIAANYGIVGASDLVSVGANYYMPKSSPYAVAILTPPPGYTQAAWNAVLKKTSLGAVYGPFTADDGAGAGLGNLGSASPWKSSLLGMDVRINNVDAIVDWGQGLPATSVQSIPSSLAANSVYSLIGMSPSGVVTPNQLQISAQTAYTLSSVFSSAFGLTTRSGASLAVNKTYCAFSGNQVVADPTFAPSNFDPTKIPALGSKLNLASLSAEQQCLLGTFYASAVGTCGAVLIEHNGNDYHPQCGDPATISKTDVEAGLFLSMFLAACDAAGQPGVFIDVSNGNCSAKGVSSASVPVYGSTNVAMSPAKTDGDSGGSYNAAYIICYHPISPPAMKSLIGSLDAKTGNVTAPGNITSVSTAMAGLYLTALQYLKADVSSAVAAMSNVGAVSASSTSSLTLLA